MDFTLNLVIKNFFQNLIQDVIKKYRVKLYFFNLLKFAQVRLKTFVLLRSPKLYNKEPVQYLDDSLLITVFIISNQRSVC